MHRHDIVALSSILKHFAFLSYIAISVGFWHHAPVMLRISPVIMISLHVPLHTSLITIVGMTVVFAVSVVFVMLEVSFVCAKAGMAKTLRNNKKNRICRTIFISSFIFFFECYVMLMDYGFLHNFAFIADPCKMQNH